MFVHRRQFLLGKQKFLPNENWQAYPVGPSTWLSCCGDLQVKRVADRDGRDWYILGLVVESDRESPAPERGISQVRSEQVPTLYSSWTGRWLLVGNSTVHLDASGLLGCFYSRDPQGQLWAASSAAILMKKLFPDTSPISDRRILRHEIGISWYAPPRSRFAGVARLLPSQVLNLERGRPEPRPLMPEIQLGRDYQSTLQQIQEILVTSLKRLAVTETDLWLGLTAGYDSRLMLALSCQAGIRVRPFTRVTARMSVADWILPPQLARACGYSHTFVRSRRRYPNRKNVVAAHTANHVSTGDAEPFIQGIRDSLKGIAFGGHGFSIASGFARMYELSEQAPDAIEGARQIARIFAEPAHSSATAGIENWLTWALEHPQPHLNWRDRFFIEQRQAGWLSSKEQLYDLTDLARFPILNCARLSSVLLGVEPANRLDSKIQRDLLERLAPQLTCYPFNPSDFEFNLARVAAVKARDLPQYFLTNSTKWTRQMLNLLAFKY